VVLLIVNDDGKGFDLSDHTPNFGLARMREMVDCMGGQIETEMQIGKGVALITTIPKVR
jgi:signal transduction histidine kinase